MELVHNKQELKRTYTPKPSFATSMMPNNVLKTASMAQETAAERDYAKKSSTRDVRSPQLCSDNMWFLTLLDLLLILRI